jgi:hypothetical protein
VLTDGEKFVVEYDTIVRPEKDRSHYSLKDRFRRYRAVRARPGERPLTTRLKRPHKRPDRVLPLG